MSDDASDQSGITFPNPAKVLKLRNATCVYCLREFGPELQSQAEHVVARRFVPTGSLNGIWNLIVHACEACNAKKSRWEDHVSAVSFQADAYGRHAADEVAVRAEGVRKARGSVSPRTGKTIANSDEAFRLRGSSSNGQIEVELKSPAQMHHETATQLAFAQIAAFFYFNSYDKVERKGRRWIGQFAPIDVVHRADWGNEQVNWFSSHVAAWDHRFWGATANDFFKVLIRRAPNDENLWAWALQWNCAYRVYGFMGENRLLDEVIASVPPLRFAELRTDDGSVFRFRKEVPSLGDDGMFFKSPPMPTPAGTFTA
jgi:hypothetical protein